jgi:RimK family alpha-L-glutamate ligase
MRIVTLSARSGWHTDELDRAARARGCTHHLARYEDLIVRAGGRAGVASAGVDLETADVVLARIIPSGSLEQLIFRVDALHQLAARGTPVINSARSIERSVDKAWTTSLLQQAGLLVPDTVVCDTLEAAEAGFRELGGDVIVKPLFGSMGLGMLRVDDADVAWRVFRTIQRIQGVYYLQRMVPHEGSDIRAFVLGGRVLGAIERRAPGWRTNVARGGAARAIDLPADLASVAVQAADSVGADYAGVDLLPGRDGRVYVLEVNGIPGWEGLQQATGIDVAAALIELACARAGAGPGVIQLAGSTDGTS